MKKLISLILLAALAALGLSGCGGGEAEARKLSFAESASLETLRALDGKRVTLTGYMATLSPLSGAYIYLMNLPYQSCPFCVPNTQQLANTMAVYAPEGSKFEYTDRPGAMGVVASALAVGSFWSFVFIFSVFLSVVGGSRVARLSHHRAGRRCVQS